MTRVHIHQQSTASSSCADGTRSDMPNRFTAAGTQGSPAPSQTTTPKKPTDKRFIDITGQKFGRLFAREYAGKNARGAHLWRCDCDCGAKVVVTGSNMRYLTTRSCGCLAHEIRTSMHRTHGLSCNGDIAPEYAAYTRAKERCNSLTSAVRHHYGGRGIKFNYVSLEQFLADVGMRPGADYSLDRIDVNGHYEPGNCRWATKQQQSRNRRDAVKIPFRGENVSMHDACDVTGIPFSVAIQRYRSGWCGDCAVTIPVGARWKVRCTHRSDDE